MLYIELGSATTSVFVESRDENKDCTDELDTDDYIGCSPPPLLVQKLEAYSNSNHTLLGKYKQVRDGIQPPLGRV